MADARLSAGLGQLIFPPAALSLSAKWKSVDVADGIDPILNQPHYVAVLETRLWRKVLITTSPKAVHPWQKETRDELPPPSAIQTRFNVQIVPHLREAEKAADMLLR